MRNKMFLVCKQIGILLRNLVLVSKPVFYHVQKSNFVLTSLQDHVYLVGINRPEKRNCVNHETGNHLKRAFLDFSENEDAYVAVLYGVGGTFCAGYDLQEVSKGINLSKELQDGPMGPTKLSLEKPVIAAIDGYAVAGGMELALWCDLRVMEETAFIGALCRRFGVPLIDGGTVRLPELVGLARSLDLILTGRNVSAFEAHQMGLVTKLCKKGEALNAAIELAKDISEIPQDYIKAYRGLVHKSSFPSSFNKVLK